MPVTNAGESDNAGESETMPVKVTGTMTVSVKVTGTMTVSVWILRGNNR